MWEFLPENIDWVIVEHPAIEGPFVATEASDGPEIAHPGAISTIAVDPLRIAGIKPEELGEEDAALHLKFLIQMDDRAELVGGDLVEVSNHDRHAC